jgi:hypothetical protein
VAPAGAILLVMLPQNPNPMVSYTVSVETSGTQCTSALIELYADSFQQATLPRVSTSFDQVGVLAHLLGHALGFNHNEDAPGACGGAMHADLALMQAMPVDKPEYSNRTLWYDDWIGLRSGPCAHTPTLSDGEVRVERTDDAGANWSSHPTWPAGNGTNLGPAIAFGVQDGVEQTVQAVCDVDNQIDVGRYDAVAKEWSDGIVDADACMAGPAAAYSPDLDQFLVCYPRLTSANQGEVRCYRKLPSDPTWYGTTNPTIVTADRVALAWHSTYKVYYMVFTGVYKPGGDPLDAGRLQITWSSDGQTWATPVVLKPGIHFSAGGPGIVCPSSPSVGNRCWVLYPDARVTSHTLREVIFIPNAGGVIDTNTAFTQDFAFPAWNGDWVASRHDVATTYDADGASIVLGFQSLPSLASGMGLWISDVDSNGPPGFGAYPASGFLSGSAALTGVAAGVALTNGAAPNTVYLMAHAL